MTLRVLLLALIAALGLQAELTADQERRADELKSQLLAPCCWSETVAEHRSEVSLEMREEVESMVAAGRTDREILDHYKAQYGMRILVEPEGGLFWVMNVVPAVMLVLGGVAVVFFLRRMMKPIPSEATEQGT